MASEIRVDTLKTTSGLGTVSFGNNGVILSGIVTATSVDAMSHISTPEIKTNKLQTISGIGTLVVNSDISTKKINIGNETNNLTTNIKSSINSSNNTVILPPNNGSSYQILGNGANPGEIEYIDRTVRLTANSGSAIPFPSTGGPISVDFNIPSWAKKVNVLFSDVSISGSSTILVQLGTSSSIENTNYDASVLYNPIYYGTNSNGQVYFNYYWVNRSTIGFPVNVVASGYNPGASAIYSGSLSLSNIHQNIWIGNGNMIYGGTDNVFSMAGKKTLSNTLTQIRITTSNTTDQFDGGIINILCN